MKGAIMNNDEFPYSNYEAQIKNGHLRIKGVTHLGCLALTSIVYDGDIRIPCVVIEQDGMVRCVSFKLRYIPWFAGRSIVKGLKFIMFPKGSANRKPS